MKKLFIVLLSVLMVLSLAGCKEKEPEEKKKILSVAFGGGTPLTMDPALNSASNGSNIIKLTDAGLMGYDENGKLACELAASYTVSEDGMTYVFTLREGLKWSDGTDFKASDLFKSWERAASDELGADYGFLYDMFKDENGKIKVEADDATKTVTCHLNYAAPYFLDLCAFPVFFPVKVENADNEGIWAIDPAKHIGMGAFKLVSYKVDDVIEYEKNPYYWNAEKVELDGVKCWLSEDNTAILTGYENGTTDLINSIAPEEFDRLKATYGSEFVIADQMGTWYVLFNVYKDMSPVGGKQLTVQEQCDVRYALGLMVDREVLTTEVYVAGEKAATGFYPAGLSDGLNADVRASEMYGTWYTGTHTPSAKNAKYTEDQVTACELLIAAGFNYTGSIEGGDIKFTNVPAVEFSFNNSGANALIIQYVQECWNKFGISAVILQDAWATLQQELKKGNAEAARMGWVADFNDVTNFIEIFISASGNNYPRLGREIGTYSKASDVSKDAGIGAYWGLEGNQTWAEAFDALDQAILYATNATERAKLAAQAEQVLMATGAVAPMYFYTNPYMLKSNVTGVNVLVTGDIIVTYAKIK